VITQYGKLSDFRKNLILEGLQKAKNTLKQKASSKTYALHVQSNNTALRVVKEDTNQDLHFYPLNLNFFNYIHRKKTMKVHVTFRIKKKPAE